MRSDVSGKAVRALLEALRCHLALTSFGSSDASHLRETMFDAMVLTTVSLKA